MSDLEYLFKTNVCWGVYRHSNVGLLADLCQKSIFPPLLLYVDRAFSSDLQKRLIPCMVSEY